jgi:hypothetical protein
MPETICGSERLESKLVRERAAVPDIQVAANHGPPFAAPTLPA